ncbi:hypothetical protein [Bacillus sp. JJ722]|uniref:hypothetical protein n=1 Tax=Bacillus sp. JJ722 TaxID=3122973 RepID=UPI002FFF88F5
MSNLNLKKLIDQNIIEKTDGTRKLTIKGKTSSYPVYRIPVEYLHYNDRNGRIISSINRYESEGNKLDLSDKEAYNNILQQYIIDSNKNALNETKNNIKMFGQRLPGVVLNDGRVIDGNRRFTCIRLINQEDGTNLYFEAVILNQEDGLTDTDIKRLELNLQHGEERPVDYDPIDNLVEIYTVIVSDKLFSVEEYAHNTNKKKGEVEKMVKKANLMVEFLEFINAEGKFYVARELSLDGPLQEIMGILNKEDASDEVEYMNVKNALFAAMAIPHKGDLTRHIREIGKNILRASNREEFLEDYEEVVEDVFESFQDQENVTKETIREINAKSKVKEKSQKLIDDKIKDTLITKIQDQPVDSMQTAMKAVEGIDLDQVARLDAESKEKLAKIVNAMNEKTKAIGEKLGI